MWQFFPTKQLMPAQLCLLPACSRSTCSHLPSSLTPRAPAALQALRSVIPYLQSRPIHAVLFVERLDEYRVDSVDHQVGLQTDRGGGGEDAGVCGNHAGRALGL